MKIDQEIIDRLIRTLRSKFVQKGDNFVAFYKAEDIEKFLVEKYSEQWVKDNPELFSDIQELAETITEFNNLYGTNLTLKFDE